LFGRVFFFEFSDLNDGLGFKKVPEMCLEVKNKLGDEQRIDSAAQVFMKVTVQVSTTVRKEDEVQEFGSN